MDGILIVINPHSVLRSPREFESLPWRTFHFEHPDVLTVWRRRKGECTPVVVETANGPQHIELFWPGTAEIISFVVGLPSLPVTPMMGLAHGA